MESLETAESCNVPNTKSFTDGRARRKHNAMSTKLMKYVNIMVGQGLLQQTVLWLCICTACTSIQPDIAMKMAGICGRAAASCRR